MNRSLLFRTTHLLLGAIVVIAACEIVDEFHFQPGSSSTGFAAAQTGDFYAVNQGSTLGCFSTGSPNGTYPTDGVYVRPIQHLSTSYESPTDYVWGVLALGTYYQATYESKFNLIGKFDANCGLVSAGFLPFPPQDHDYFVYDIAAAESGDVYVLVDDTNNGNDSYRIFHTTDEGSTWTDYEVPYAERVALISTCTGQGNTPLAHMSYDRPSDEIVLLACDTALRYDAATLTYLGSRTLGITVGPNDVHDFEMYLGGALVSYDNGVEDTIVITNPLSPYQIIEERAGIYGRDVQVRQSSLALINANPWGARFYVNGIDPSHPSDAVHQYKGLSELL